MEQIRRDLDNDDEYLFDVFYRNKPLKRRANSENDGDRSDDLGSFDDRPFEEKPSVEWLPSSGDDSKGNNSEEGDRVDDNLASLRD